MHIRPKRGAPLKSAIGVVHSAGRAGNSIHVGAAVAGVVGAVRVVVMVVVVAWCWLGGGQAKGVVQEQMHLLSHFINGRLGAQSGRVGVTFDLVAASETQRTEKAVHIRLFERFGLTLEFRHKRRVMMQSKEYVKQEYSRSCHSKPA